MNLAYSLSELEKIYLEANSYYIEYKNSIESLDVLINNLEKTWISDETNSYEQLKKLYEEKKQKLKDACFMMEKMCNKLDSKISELKENTKKTINNFE